MPRSPVALGIATLGVLGLLRAAQLAWLCDDSFISLRYAENLAAGHGLVYNPGEYVEGYSNLLWTLLLAGFAKAGADPVGVARYLGLVAYAALAAGLVWSSWRRAAGGRHAFFPLAAALVLVSEDFHVWASGGLETMLFTALAVWALLLTRGPAQSPGRPLAAGVLLALLILTRPDGPLFVLAGAASYWLPPDRLAPRERLRASLLLLAPVALVLAVWIPFKLAYYGDLFPTAFYSKSAARPYYSQGLVYLGLYLAKNWVLVAAFAAAFLARRRGWVRPMRSDDWESAFWLGSAGLYLAHLVHVGGDFMFARRLLPAIPFLWLALERHLTLVPDARTRLGIGAIALIAAMLTVPLYGDSRVRIHGVADEPRFYPPEVIELRRRQARIVGEALTGTGARVAFEGGMCMFGYYSGLPYLVEMTGLTQYSLAKLPLEKRGPIGHEKRPTREWLVANDIHFVVYNETLDAVGARPPRADEVTFSGMARAAIIRYDDAVMAALAERPFVSFVPIGELIEDAQQRIRSSSAAEARTLYARLDAYYFRGAGERGREAAEALRALVASRPLEGGRRP